MTANGISIRYELAGQGGPLVVLLHEMGGTLEGWDGVVPALRPKFRTLRYDQRGAGLSEKVRAPFTHETLVDDLEAVLAGLKLAPPFHFVTVAGSTAQALSYLERHPGAIGSFVFCNPLTGVDPARAGALTERAALAERDGMRAALAVTLDKSWPPDFAERAAYEAYRGRYLANDPFCFGAMNRALAGTDVRHLVKAIDCPTMIVAGRFDQVRPATQSEELARNLTGARFELIDAGHMLPPQAPQILSGLLADFLGRVTAPQRAN
jgi:3-oxoadipate enol-lactonase